MQSEVFSNFLIKTYNNRSDYFYMPCDGVANGFFGPGTQNIVRNKTIQSGTTGIFAYLFKAAMICNGFDCVANNSFSSSDVAELKNFQSFYKIGVTGTGTFETWASLLVSTGDPNRKGQACDCVTEITDVRAKALKAAGYKAVGRYLTNVEGISLNKKIQTGELNTIFNNGLTIYPIYQTYGGATSYFNYNQGKKDGIAAVKAAKGYGFNKGTIIYFAVDYDALGGEIDSNIIPHFKGIAESISSLGGFYSIGIYGPRNVCIKVSEEVAIKTSFVSGMSVGFSGNLGFPLPYNWAFDQISTINVGSGNGFIEIDNNIMSGRDSGQSSVKSTSISRTPDVITDSKYISKVKSETANHIANNMSKLQKDKSLKSREEASNTILKYDARITSICQKYGIRKALVQSVLMWESCLEGIDDALTDSLVVATYDHMDNPLLPPPSVVRTDCSTGIGQIFAWVAIDAINFARIKGLYSSRKYDLSSLKDIREIWTKLHSNINFSIEMCAIVLLHAASKKGISVSYNNYKYVDNEIEKIIARYNGTGDGAAEYGKINMKTYHIFETYNELSRR